MRSFRFTADAKPASGQFASDNRSNICPEAWEALAQANGAGQSGSYGDDQWTRRAITLIREMFETDCDVHFLFNGTAANALALASLCKSYESAICHEFSHIKTDECNAPGFFAGGVTLTAVAGGSGKLAPAAVAPLCNQRLDSRFPPPRAISLTQATELGTSYSPEEIGSLSEIARANGLRMHVDGARFANAVAFTKQSPAELTWKAGVNVLSFGATKNGISAGEALVFFDQALSQLFAHRCKQAGQIASKMRLLTSQWVGVLENGAWLKHASQANAMAQRLESELRSLGLPIAFPVQANGVFAIMPAEMIDALRQIGWLLYSPAGVGAVRLMCSWDTTEDDVMRLVTAVRELQSAEE